MAQVQVGYLYEVGDGLPQNNAEAARWYARAADLGNPQAACNLGHLYEAGTGVDEDWVTAAKWYRKSADQHNRRCEASMARAYRFGIGVANVALLLRGSPDVAQSSLETARELAASGVGEDPHGDRREFLALIDQAQRLR